LILIGPFEQSLKGFKPSDFIDRDATYSEILQQAKRAKIGLEKNLREAIKKEEKFSETARNILSQIGVFEKINERPYYILSGVSANKEQLKRGYQSIFKLYLSERILIEQTSSNQITQWKVVLKV
jgi:hypothetical protein